MEGDDERNNGELVTEGEGGEGDQTERGRQIEESIWKLNEE